MHENHIVAHNTDPLVGPEVMGKHPMCELTEMLQDKSQKVEIKTDDGGGGRRRRDGRERDLRQERDAQGEESRAHCQ